MVGGGGGGWEKEEEDRYLLEGFVHGELHWLVGGDVDVACVTDAHLTLRLTTTGHSLRRAVPTEDLPALATVMLVGK